MIKKTGLLILALLIRSACCCAQNADDGENEPLKQVLTEIEARYHVVIKYDESLVKDKVVSFAKWRFRPDADKNT